MENKNLHPMYGDIRLIHVTYSNRSSFAHSISSNSLLKKTFKNCFMLLENDATYVFTSLFDQIPLDIYKRCNHSKVHRFDDLDQTFSREFCSHYLIFWEKESDCRVVRANINKRERLKLLKRTSITDVDTSAFVKVDYDSLNETYEHITSEIVFPGFNCQNQQTEYKCTDTCPIYSIKYCYKVIPGRCESFQLVLAIRGPYPVEESDANSSAAVHFSEGFTYPIISPKYPDFAELAHRLGTYERWRRENPTPSDLSSAGFFFTNREDLVRCYQYGIGLKDFSDNVDPLIEHVRHSTRCEFLLKHIGPSKLAEMEPRLQSTHHCKGAEEGWSIKIDLPPTGTYPVRTQKYQTFEARMNTFLRWPRSTIQMPEKLAVAGFYYTGVEDHVRCFTCDGGLRRWDSEDDPWIEHCRWFPACPFVRNTKGDLYVSLALTSIAHGNEDRLSADAMMSSQNVDRITLSDAELRTMYDHLREMGFSLQDCDDAIKELKNRGNSKPTLDDMLSTILKDEIEDDKGACSKQNETMVEENRRLRRMVICMICERKKINALFLPCTHHRLCLKCAKPLKYCPVCNRNIRERSKRTYCKTKPSVKKV